MITVADLPDIARGCSVLGAGGGGETYTAMMMATQAIGDFGPVQLVDFDDLPDSDIVMSCGFLGAPTVTIEKLSSGEEGLYLREEVERFRGARVAALMCAEIGGSNGMVPLTWAARLGLPYLSYAADILPRPEASTVVVHRLAPDGHDIRTSARPGSARLTSSAMITASAIDAGIVPSANHALLPSARQKMGSATIAA